MLDRLNAKLSELSHDSLIRCVPWLGVVAILILMSVFAIYAVNFSAGHSLSNEPANWGQFGDFVGGTANPILAFLTFVGLLLTLAIQGKQLENSNKQLEVTMQDLSYAREAENISYVEMTRQTLAARRSTQLASINLLLQQYRLELANLSSQMIVASDPRQERIRQLQIKESALLELLDKFFVEIVSGHQELLRETLR